MRPNIKQYESFIRKAKSLQVDFLLFNKSSLMFANQADIIVFSEDGLTGFEFLYSEYFLPFTQFLPDASAFISFYFFGNFRTVNRVLLALFSAL